MSVALVCGPRDLMRRSLNAGMLDRLPAWLLVVAFLYGPRETVGVGSNEEKLWQLTFSTKF